MCSELDRRLIEKTAQILLAWYNAIIKMSHLLCQVWQSIPSSSVSDSAMKDMLPMALAGSNAVTAATDRSTSQKRRREPFQSC